MVASSRVFLSRKTRRCSFWITRGSCAGACRGRAALPYVRACVCALTCPPTYAVPCPGARGGAAPGSTPLMGPAVSKRGRPQLARPLPCSGVPAQQHAPAQLLAHASSKRRSCPPGAGFCGCRTRLPRPWAGPRCAGPGTRRSATASREGRSRGGSDAKRGQLIKCSCLRHGKGRADGRRGSAGQSASVSRAA